MKPTPEDALGKLAMAHLLGALEDTEAALFEACAAEHPETEAVLAEAREDLACVDAPPVAAPEGAWRKIQEQLRHKRAGTEPAQPLAPDDVILVSCSYCRDGLERASTVYCASCLAPHHPDCFREHGRCSVMGCGETQIVRAVGHRELEPPAPEKLAPRRSRWRRRAGLGVFVLVGGGLAAYSGDLAEVAVATGHREDPEAGLEEELWKRGVELGYRAGSSGSTAGTAPTRTPTQPLLRAEWRDATLGEVLTALREAGVPLELRGEGWADAEVADQALTEQGAGSLLGSLAEALGLACVAEPSGWVLDAGGAPPPPAAPKLRDGAGIYRVDALDPTRVTALDFAPADPAEVQVAAGSERWAIRSGGTLRVYEGARLLCELPQSREATGLALDARGERVAWVRGRTLCVCDPASEDALTGAVSERELPWPPSYMAPPQGPSEAILDYDRAGNLLVVCSRGGWVLGADGRAAADWAPIPALAFGPLLRGVAERGSAAVPAGGPRARLVPSAGSGWRVFVSDAEGLKALIYEVGVTREGPLALRGLGQNLSLPARGEVALDALADALRRRELGIGCERMDEEEASALAARGEAGRALVARAFGRWAVASVYRVTQEGQPGWALDLQRQGDRATLDLDAADGEVTHVLWQGAERLLVLQQSRHSVAVHTIACPSGPLSQAQVVHTLHAAVSGVLGAYVLGEGQLALRLASKAPRAPHVWARDAASGEAPRPSRARPTEVRFYSARWAEPVPDAPSVSPPAAAELRRLPSDAAYREARAAVLQRAVLEYPSAGRVLRDVPPGAPQRAEAEQLLAYLLAHGVTHCQDLYREGKADSALLLGRQLLELAEGSPLREGFAEELAQWAQVLDAFTRAADEGPGSPRSLEAWNEVLQLERSFDNYYSRRARRALAEIASLSEGAPPAKPDEAPAPLAPSPRLAHVAAGQRWVFRGQGGAETEWEVVRVEGDAVVYRETAHLPGRAMVEPASEKRWTPAELNLGRAQGGGVELRGPQALDVPGVTLRYTVRKVGEVEHWIAVDLLDQPTFPGIVRDARENGVALELVRVEQR